MPASDDTLSELRNPHFALTYLARVGHSFTREGQTWKGICCFHGDSDPSLKLHRDGGLYCYGCGWAGSVLDYVIERAGGDRHGKAAIHQGLVTLGLSQGRPYRLPPLPPVFAAPPPADPALPARLADRTHPWYTRAGDLAMTRRRWYLTEAERGRYGGRDKLIRPFLPDGRLGEPKDADLAIYGGPALPPADPACPVFVSESESDADALTAAGAVAVATGGSQRWRDVWGADLGGRWLVLLPHHDEGGQGWADRVTGGCRAHAPRITVLPLPGLGPHGDVRDFLAAGHTRDTLEVLAGFAPALPAVDRRTGEILDGVPAAGTDGTGWQQRAAEAEAFLAWIQTTVYDKAMTPCDRLALVQLEFLCRAEGWQAGDTVEVEQKALAAKTGTSPATFSRNLDRFDAMGLTDHQVVRDEPRINRNGQPWTDAAGHPIRPQRTVLSLYARPSEATIRLEPTEPRKRQGGARTKAEAAAPARLCPNPACPDDQAPQRALAQCTACGTVHEGATGACVAVLPVADALPPPPPRRSHGDATGGAVNVRVAAASVREVQARQALPALDPGDAPAPRDPADAAVCGPPRDPAAPALWHACGRCGQINPRRAAAGWVCGCWLTPPVPPPAPVGEESSRRKDPRHGSNPRSSNRDGSPGDGRPGETEARAPAPAGPAGRASPAARAPGGPPGP